MSVRRTKFGLVDEFSDIRDKMEAVIADVVERKRQLLHPDLVAFWPQRPSLGAYLASFDRGVFGLCSGPICFVTTDIDGLKKLRDHINKTIDDYEKTNQSK